MRLRGELAERSVARLLDRGGMGRAWLRGRENVHKRYLIHVAGFNRSVRMRALFGEGTPREAGEALKAILFVALIDAAIFSASSRSSTNSSPRSSSSPWLIRTETESGFIDGLLRETFSVSISGVTVMSANPSPPEGQASGQPRAALRPPECALRSTGLGSLRAASGEPIDRTLHATVVPHLARSN